MREIKIVSTKTNRKVNIQSDARTWGELQNDLSRNQIQFNDMSAVVRETRVTLEDSQATLPEGPFALFLLPKKVKSGQNTRDAVINIIALKTDVVTLRDRIKSVTVPVGAINSHTELLTRAADFVEAADDLVEAIETADVSPEDVTIMSEARSMAMPG